jgi:hypothetical protein
MAIEEMAELTKALSKAYRKFEYREIIDVLEEIADVKIMIDQLTLLFEPPVNNSEISYRVSLAEEGKLIRLAHRMGVEYQPNAADCAGQNCHACANPCEKYTEVKE